MIINRGFQVLKNYLKHLPLAVLAQLRFGFPARKLKIILVSGTDGKTTTSTFIHHLLVKAGRPAGIISTVQAKWNNIEIPTGLHVTNPDSWRLNQLLSQMVKDKIRYLVLETTSHGIDQFRIWGIKPYIYVITNVSHEHLDYHPSFKHYLKTKLKLVKSSRYLVYNHQDNNLRQALGSIKEAYGVSLNKRSQANLILELVEVQNDKGLLQVTSHKPKARFKLLTNYFQKFNLTNLGLAIQTALILGISPKKIQQQTPTLPQIPGRLEKIDTAGENFQVFVDFAHTPNALKSALEHLRSVTPQGGRLIAVFGSAGLRDKSKRPLLVQAAQKYADVIVLTAEDPRTEKVDDIIKQMATGFNHKWRQMKSNDYQNLQPYTYLIIPDRQEAINAVINHVAADNDIIGFFGKGHEKSICYGKVELPWDEQKTIKKAILARLYQDRVAGVVLAAGKGTRISQLTKNKLNKAMVPVLGKPMVGWARDLLTDSGIKQQYYVVGYKQKLIKDYLGSQTNYIIQKKQLGTGDTIKHVLPELNAKIRHVIVINADQSFYQPEVLTNLVNFYLNGGYDAAILSTLKDNPTGLGRIVRNKQGYLTAIVEEVQADTKTKKIKEINTGTYVFNRGFLEKYINQLELHEDKNEYYLTDIFAVALKQDPKKVKIGVLQINNPLVNIGFNTPQQLEQGERVLKKFYPNLK